MAKLIPNATHYDRPTTDAELAGALNHPDQKVFVTSGGTSLSFNKPNADRIVDLSKMPLKGCRKDSEGNLEIGALTTMGDLESDPIAAPFCQGIFPQTTDQLALTPLRNLITVGGNLAAGYAWSDLPVTLLALDAEYQCSPDGAYKAIPSDGDTSFRRLAGKDKIIARIRINKEYADACGAFIKFARTSSDLTMVSTAVTMTRVDGKMSNVRVVAGGLVPSPLRLTDVEKILEGQAPCQQLFEKAAAAATVKPRPDQRADAAYRQDVLKTIIARACSAAVKE